VIEPGRLRDGPARLAIFASGEGSNLGALMAAFPATDAVLQVALVISDRSDAPALARAAAAGIPAHHLPFGRDRVAFERAARRLLQTERIDFVALAGFMRVLSADFVESWYGRLVNIHPSLLPAFPGLHAVRQALAAGAPESGCTVHFVDAGVDTGPAIAQRVVPILPGDDEATLQARIRAQEHQLYPAAIRQLVTGAVRLPERSA